VAELPRLDALEAKVYVLEADAGGLKAGVTATVVVDGRPETRAEGPRPHRRHAGPAAHSGRAGAVFRRGARVRRAARREGQAGQRVEATIVLEERAGAITVPRQAVFEADGRSVVYVRRGSRFEPKDVRLGPAGLGRQVIEDGVEPGELVALRDPTREANDEREERDEREGKDGSAVAGAPRRAGP
jgi:hypothetical protein